MRAIVGLGLSLVTLMGCGGAPDSFSAAITASSAAAGSTGRAGSGSGGSTGPLLGELTGGGPSKGGQAGASGSAGAGASGAPMSAAGSGGTPQGGAGSAGGGASGGLGGSGSSAGAAHGGSNGAGAGGMSAAGAAGSAGAGAGGQACVSPVCDTATACGLKDPCTGVWGCFCPGGDTYCSADNHKCVNLTATCSDTFDSRYTVAVMLRGAANRYVYCETDPSPILNDCTLSKGTGVWSCLGAT